MFNTINMIMMDLKREKPLVLNITNDVSMDFIANGLLSVGASPVMSKAIEEIQDLLKIAPVLVINLGTLNKEFITLSRYACEIANQLNKPIILDPVGVGASHYRTETSQQLINDFDIAIIRGNASEIMALSGSSLTTKGVDSSAESASAIESAKIISKRHQSTVFVSGKIDVVVEGDKIHSCDRGSALMPMVTGTGCLLSAVVGAFHAVCKDRFKAATAAAVFYGVCGEIAETKASSPGSFKTQFLDALHLELNRDFYEKN